MKELYEKYMVKKKGLKTVTEEIKQRMLAKSAKVKRYEQRIEKFRQNRIFDLNQKIYTELKRNGMGSDRMMYQMQKNTQSFGVMSEKSITERQNG